MFFGAVFILQSSHLILHLNSANPNLNIKKYCHLHFFKIKHYFYKKLPKKNWYKPANFQKKIVLVK